MESCSVAKAVYDFSSADEKELALQIGDIIVVTKHVDKQWSHGICNGKEGNFPTGFAIELKLPALEENQELFVPITDFNAQQLGDLSFKKGDLVVGIRAIDSNWWEGHLNGNSGIFPLNYVWQIDRELLPRAVGPKKVSLKAQVKMNVKAQLKEEMDLVKDEIVHVTEEIDESWYRGECNGRSGIFPSSFVTILADDIEVSHSAAPSEHSVDQRPEQKIYSNDEQKTSDSQYGYDCVNSGIAAYGLTKYPFKAEFENELSFGEGEIVKLILHVDENWMQGEIDGRVGIFPKSFVNVIVNCHTDEVSEVLQNKVFPADTYGRVLFAYDPPDKNEAKLREGDTVTLVRKISEDWTEVVTDNGESCVSPSSYLEVIGSGPDLFPPPSYSEVMKADLESTYGTANKQTRKSAYLGLIKAERPSSYPSPSLSFDWSPNESRGSSGSDLSFKVSQSIDDKIVDDSFNLDSSFESGRSFSRSLSVSSSGSYSVSDRSGSHQHRFSTSPSLSVQGNSSLEDSPSYSNIESIGNNCAWNSDAKNILALKTPLRPPPPVSNKASSTRPISNVCNTNFTASSANELKQEIAAKEEKLKKLSACKAKLENEKSSSQGNPSFVNSDIHCQLTQLTDEMRNITQEISVLKDSLQSAESECADNINEGHSEREIIALQKKGAEEKRREEERKKKIKEQRLCVITEILQTERDYLSDLKILFNTFLQDPNEGIAKGIDMMTLFGNLDEVIDVATRLLGKLEKTSRSANQMIGECFVEMSGDMKEVYGHYCRNHDDVNAVLDKYDAKSPAGKYLKHKVELLKRQTNCFDLPSMLIKPVQRILKYPLLLNELVKCTDDGHTDKQWLIKAIELMTDVATAINEFKRRQDLVFKYRKHADTSLSGRISKFNIHSVLKKSSRFGMRLSNTIGLTSVTRDENFEKQERQFHGLEKTIKIFIKDVNGYVEKTEELVKTAFRLSEDIAEFYGEKKNQQEVDRFRSVHRLIVTQFFEAYKQNLERNVMSTLKQMLQTYHGPSNLIQKRYDKLLDYEACTNKAEKNKDATRIKMLQESQQVAKNTYEALNTQLLDDLPRLHSMSIEIIRDCIRFFMKARKNFIGRCAREMLNLTELHLLLGSQSVGGGILETFQVKHNIVTDDLCKMAIVPKQLFLPSSTSTLKRNSSPTIGRPGFGAANSFSKQLSQSAVQKTFVKSTYPCAQLYTAYENFNAVDVLDLNLRKGDIVGAVKQQDPTGGKLRWFVDNGAAKGFVPAKILVKFIPDISPPSSAQLSVSRRTQHSSFGKGDVSEPVPPYSSSLPRNAPSRRSLPSEMLEKKPLERPSYANSSKRSEVLQPVRPAPPPRYDLVDSTDQGSCTAPAKGTLLMPDIDAGQNVSDAFMTSSNSEEVQPHRYEEIEELLNCYDSVSGDEKVASNSANLPSLNVSVDEFDPYGPLSTPKQLYDNVPNDDRSPDVYNGHRYEVIPEDSATDQTDASEYYYAMYGFVPRGLNQMQLSKGQVVLVLHKCDLNQNTEWWFVEDRHGNKGYVPANYLKSYSSATVASAS